MGLCLPSRLLNMPVWVDFRNAFPVGVRLRGLVIQRELFYLIFGILRGVLLRFSFRREETVNGVATGTAIERCDTPDRSHSSSICPATAGQQLESHQGQLSMSSDRPSMCLGASIGM